jgi:hypothetical protein
MGWQREQRVGLEGKENRCKFRGEEKAGCEVAVIEGLRSDIVKRYPIIVVCGRD